MIKVRQRIPALGAVALLLAVTLLLGAVVVLLGAPPASAKVGLGSVRMTVADVRPNSPKLSNSSARPLAVALTLTNLTAQTLADVTVSADRGDPITSQRKLDEAIAKPRPPSPALVAPLHTMVPATLAPHSTVDLVFRTKTDIASDAELCLCANAIYPLYFTATYMQPSGVAVQLAVAQTYLPSFLRQPVKARIGWLWPLLDRPHRLTSDTVFIDDNLADEVRPGGRLDRLLSVVEQLDDASVAMTLVTDPDLIDELAVMSHGYSVTTSKGTVRGTGGEAAAAWLRRLNQVLGHHRMELVFTPTADPAVESVQRSGLSWSVGFPVGKQQQRVTQALALSTPLTDIAWPAGGTVGIATLATLVTQGAKTVVLSDKVLSRGASSTVVPDALAPVRTSAGQAVAAVTSSTVQRWVAAVLQPGGQGVAALPQLVAELAIRVVNSLARSHYVVITPPRALTVADPAVAVRMILATTVTPWSTALPLRAAASAITPVDHGQLRSSRAAAPQLPRQTVEALHYVTDSSAGLADLFVPPVNPATDADYRAAQARLAELPIAVQRCESTSLLGSTDASNRLAERLESRVRDGIRNQISLVRPSGGSARASATYTLTSKNSKLPVTIVNRLADEVQVRLSVTAAGGPGFRADDLDVRVKPNSTMQVRVPTHVDRVGRFDVSVGLSTRGGLSLGRPIALTVRSTALGTVGVVITVVAGLVLALALVGRFVRRMSKRRSKPDARDLVPAGSASA